MKILESFLWRSRQLCFLLAFSAFPSAGLAAPDAPPSLNGRDRFAPRGEAPLLRIGDINGEAVVDLSGFTAAEIDFVGSINGNPRITIPVNGGRVRFLGTINGSPRVTITGRRGVVEFDGPVGGSAKLEIEVPDGHVRLAGRVDGSVSLHAKAREVVFGTGLAGGALADLTLTQGGTLSLAPVAPGASLTYRREKASDPPLRITGKMSPQVTEATPR